MPGDYESTLLIVSLGYTNNDDNNLWLYEEGTGWWDTTAYGGMEGANGNTPAATVGFAGAVFEFPDLYYYSAVSFIFGGASDQIDPYPSLPNVWSRDFTIVGEVWFPWFSYEWSRYTCYPGYQWDATAANCVPEGFCEGICSECEDYSKIRAAYVTEIETELVTSQYSGFLRQCPAFWQSGLYIPWFWAPSQNYLP